MDITGDLSMSYTIQPIIISVILDLIVGRKNVEAER